MASRLLVLALWVGCSPCSGREAAPTQPRVRCWASRYPIAVDCVWTLPASPHPTRPMSFMATYRNLWNLHPSISQWVLPLTLGHHRLCDVGVNGSLRVTPSQQQDPSPWSSGAVHMGSRAQTGRHEGLRPSCCPYVSRLGVAGHGESQPCLQLTPEATRCTIPDVQMFSMVPYILNVTAVQPRGTSSSFLPFVPEHIIKPDPPEGVRLSPIPGQRLWVQWEPPRSWPFPETFALKYWIRYKHHRSARFRQVGPIEATSFTLRAMRPRAKYCVQVAAQDLTDYGELSDWSLPATASMIGDK
ncbi:interleukin-27 subunit beta isoform X1 [Crocuta crocuta]